MARGVRSGATILSPTLQPQSTSSYDPVTRRNTVLIATIVPTLHTAGVRALGIPADRYYANLGAVATISQLPEWAAASGGTVTFGNWDATDLRQYARLATGGSIGSAAFPKFIHYLGTFGDSTSFAPKNTTVTSVSIQFRARFPTNADYTTYGIGATVIANFATAASNHYIQVLRNVGAWELGTCDGTTISQSSGGTGDGNFHDFKVVWTVTDLKLYVDGVLTITKTTNMPTQPMGLWAANNVDAIDIVDYLVSWE